MSFLLALLSVACVSAEQQESGAVSRRSPVVEKSLMEEGLQNRAVESFERGTSDHVGPRISIGAVSVGSEITDKLLKDLAIEQQDEIVPDMDEGRFKRQAYKNDTYPVTWTRLEVPYELNHTLSKRGKSAFRKAARLWTNFTCINITEVPYDDDYEEGEEDDENAAYYDEGDEERDEDGDQDDDNEYPVIEDEYQYYYDEEWENLIRRGLITVNGGGEACVSRGIGKSPYGFQTITLGRKCQTIGTAVHELAHVLGFVHTQQRHDRDEYITVNESNIMDEYLDQFKRISNESNDNYGLPYDYGSVMQYGTTAGSENRTNTTMAPKDGLYTQTLGSVLISFYDILMMNKHYNCTDRCENYTSTQCQNGGFAHPRNCSKCICPSGYGGDFCDKRPPDVCGEELNATSNWTLLITADSSNMTHGSQDGYKKCVYWINAPNGSHVEVRLTKLPPNVAKEGCIYSGVEIKARKDQGLTGYRFCSEGDVNTTLISNTSTLPVLTYMRRRRNDTAVELEYRIANKNTKRKEEDRQNRQIKN